MAPGTLIFVEVQKRFRDWVPWRCRTGFKLQDGRQDIDLETIKHPLCDARWKIRNAKAQLHDVFSKVRETNTQLYDVFLEPGDAK